VRKVILLRGYHPLGGQKRLGSLTRADDTYGGLSCLVAASSLRLWLSHENLPENYIMKLLLKKFVQDESGQDLIEYALVAALVGLGSVASMQSLSANIANAFTGVGTALANA
jgi:pilus assembly protein Flp/PilA